MMTPTGEIKIGTLLKKIKKCDKQYIEIKVHVIHNRFLTIVIMDEAELNHWLDVPAYAVSVNYWFGQTTIYVHKEAYDCAIKGE